MRILHVMRSPVGGLFRHVCDLIAEQARLGHEAGLICDSTTGSTAAETALATLEPFCKLGIHRMAMPRLPGPKDAANVRHTARIARQVSANILHGHGAKGGLYARLAARLLRLPSVYTPHGGSLHYSWSSPQGMLFLGMEKALGKIGGNNIFVCQFERDLYHAKIGKSRHEVIVHNGLGPADFEPVVPAADGANFLFVGEMRKLKGVDVLLTALARVPGATLALAGSGPDMDEFQSLANSAGLAPRVKFLGHMPMREALKYGKVLVVPSRNESYPYVVLEAIAAGRVVIASAVGGIPEILPASLMFPPGSIDGLIEKLTAVMSQPQVFEKAAGDVLARAAQQNTVAAMAKSILAFYSELTIN